MKRFILIIAALLVMIVTAACGSSDEGGELPTIVVLPTLAEDAQPSQETQPTQEATATNTEEPTPTAEASVELPFELPQGTPETVNDTNSVPPFLAGAGGSNPFSQMNARVSSVEPVSVYSCPETTCEELGQLEPGAELEVTQPGDEWHTIQFEEQQAYVLASLVTTTAGQTTAGGPFGGGSGNPQSMTSVAPGAGFPGAGGGQMLPPGNVGLPPGINPAGVTATPPFPPAQTQAAQQQGG